MRSFESNSAPEIVYVKCTIDKKPLLNKYFNLLESMSSCKLNPDKLKVVDIEVSQAVKLTSGMRLPKL